VSKNIVSTTLTSNLNIMILERTSYIRMEEFGQCNYYNYHFMLLTQNVNDIEDVEKFHESLSTLVRPVPMHNFQIIASGMNAQLGRRDLPSIVPVIGD